MGLWILCPVSALGKLMILVINQFKNSVYWWLGTFQAPPFMQPMCCLYGRSSQQHDIHAVVSSSKREGEEVTNVGTKAQTDRQLARASPRRRWDPLRAGGFRGHIGRAGTQGWQEVERGTRKPPQQGRSLVLGMIPERQRCQGSEQSTPFLHRFCLPTGARAASSFPFPGQQHIHVPGHRVQGHMKAPKYIPPVPVLFTSCLSFSDVPLAPSKAFPRERSQACCIY